MTKRIETRKPTRKELRKTLRQTAARLIDVEAELGQVTANGERQRADYAAAREAHAKAENRLRNERDDERARAERLAAALRTIGRVQVRLRYSDPARNWPTLQAAYDRVQEIAANALDAMKGN